MTNEGQDWTAELNGMDERREIDMKRIWRL